MSNIWASIRIRFFLITAVIIGLYGNCYGSLDRSRYIGIDEIKAGVKGYCLTTYRGTEVEKFDLEVLSVVRNVNPGGQAGAGSRDIILVQGTDERFIHSGPVAGCSGSPVYIDGRLAGALAGAWAFSKDPLYAVTPIEEMLNVGHGVDIRGEGSLKSTSSRPGFLFDLSKPIDMAEIEKQMMSFAPGMRRTSSGFAPLPCPLVVSGLGGRVCEELNSSLGSLGFVAVAGVGGGVDVDRKSGAKLVPGAPLAVPLVTGDISMTGIGTVTEVVGDEVYGFGHGFLSFGVIDLPMATGQIHTVVSNMLLSFKFGGALETVGALRVDESTAVKGWLGAKAKMIPMRVKVSRFNDTAERVYNCEIVHDRLLMPFYLRGVIAGAALQMGDLPPEHMVAYKFEMEVDGADPVRFENVSTGMSVADVMREASVAAAILMNNPYKRVNVRSLNIEIREEAKNLLSQIWSAGVSDLKVKAGEKIKVEVILESVRSGKRRFEYDISVPEQLSPGVYELSVMGSYEYQQFLTKATPYKFMARNLPSLIEALNNLLNVRRDRLYCIFILPSGGITVENAELPDLPATKALIMTDPKRILQTTEYQPWIEKSYETGRIVMDKKTMRVTVE
ncbi:MAG: hypothetical protein E4H40_00725 [Candidatus Brocadiia bacterium]|nr:MAG: hypothetical protein E4H40_00725 [Candidatus Brocadiia bacterium]